MSAMPLPKNFQWVQDVVSKAGGKPMMVNEALLEFGVHEGIGALNNQEILQWAKEVGGNVANVYKADAIPWCGLFMAVCAHRAGKQLPISPLWALSWITFGNQIDEPMFGDVCVFIRHLPDGSRAGHVAIYVAETADTFWILGGNQHDEVCFEEIAKSRLYGARRPVYAIGLPDSVKKYFINTSGNLSTNEQ